MSPIAWARLVVVLARIARGPGHRPPQHILERLDDVAGTTVDVVRPTGATRGVLLALHGATLAGPDDARLRHFVACLAASGVTCVVPRLPGLSGLRFRSDDVELVTGLMQRFRDEGGGRVGLIGFSLGGGVALLAAARPGAAAWTRFVVTIGAHHDLATLLATESLTAEPPPGDPSRDAWAHFRLGQLYRNREAAHLDESAAAELTAALLGWCDRLTPSEKEAALDRHRRHLTRLYSLADDPDGAAALAAMSPAGRLHALACPAFILHAPDDELVPPEHAWRLLSEIPSRCRPRLLVTPLLSHVNARPLAAPWHLAALLRALAPLAFASSSD